MPRGLVALLLALALPAQEPPVLATRFARDVVAQAPRPEHPRAWRRPDARWRSLNGPWRLFVGDEPAARTVVVPFAPESRLSGLALGQRLLPRLRYERELEIPGEWAGRRVLLHFEAVDWQARAWLDDRELGSHRGGYDPFTFDLGVAGGPATHRLRVEVHDPGDIRQDGWQPRGKQLGSQGIFYTRTSGIWQSVWLEAVPVVALDEVRVATTHEGEVRVAASVRGTAQGPLRLAVEVRGPGKDGATLEQRQEAPLAGDTPPPALRVEGVRPWAPGSPVLYEVTVHLLEGGKPVDALRGRVGFRSVAWRDGRFHLNGAPLFLRGVLDQGYWPESGLTAPTREALVEDARLALRLGFNLVRKHVKVEEAAWYAACDELGLLVMQDMVASYALDKQEAKDNYLAEMTAMVRKLGNHPSVVHWVAFNEDWGRPGAFQEVAVRHLRRLDPTRGVTDASGWTQRDDTDITDVHDYGADLLRHSAKERRRPLILGEMGGVAFALPGHTWTEGWGYSRARSPEGFLRRIQMLCGQVYRAENLAGFVWTQLTDVEQEINGLVHYDRTPKVGAPERDHAEIAARIRGEVPAVAAVTPSEWWLLGPFPQPERVRDAQDDAGNRAILERYLHTPCVPDEGGLSPAAGGRVADRPWRQVPAQGAMLDLRAVLGNAMEHGVVYAVAVLPSDRDQRVALAFGSDDAARVWVNGAKVHEAVAVRGVDPWADEIPGVNLRAGRNLVVVKIAQGLFGCGVAVSYEAGHGR